MKRQKVDDKKKVMELEFDLNKDIVRQLNILLDLTDSVNTEEESEYIGNMGHLTFEGERMIFPKACFDTVLRVPFETEEWK